MEEVRALFREYAASLTFDLGFQNFARELAELPGKYAPPHGALFVATVGLDAAGCVAFRPLDRTEAKEAISSAYCEMKRLYVRPEFRGHAIGTKLVQTVIEQAKTCGYSFMRLDTISTQMRKAIDLYRQFGFYEIASYRYNPIPDALYLELRLADYNGKLTAGESR